MVLVVKVVPDTGNDCVFTPFQMDKPVDVDTVVLHHLVLCLPGNCQATCQELVILLNFLDEP